jgi:low affinity Fe/Cu permease
MWFQEYQRFEFLQVIADIMGLILKTLQPFVTPIGAWMVSWVGFLLKFFPTNSLAIYIAIFVILVLSGIIINLKWPGEKYIAVYTKEGSERDTDEKISNIEFYENNE